MGLLIQDAWAQGAAPAGQGDLLTSLLPLALIFVVFYFFLIRPQSKRQKEHKEMVAKVETGDEIITGGGVLGKVTGLGEQFIEIEIASGVRVKIQRHTISAVMPKGTIKSA